jgi:hypothetical protein
MRRASLFSALAALAALCLDAPSASADIASYRFLPRYSVLTEFRSSTLRPTPFRVYGMFDFLTREVPVNVGETVTAAQFIHVDAWGSHPILAYVLPLNEVLNLEGLEGRELPVAAPFDVFKFEGTTDNGSQVNLYASVIGPWLRLRGGTTPPPVASPSSTSPVYTYRISAVARETPFADFDGSGAVDRADLAAWTGGFGALPAGSEPERFGDADGDGAVSGADFLAWQRQLGEVAPPIETLDAAMDAALATLTATASSIPEPGSMAIFSLGVGVIFITRRGRAVA